MSESGQHHLYRFSVTIRTDDLALLHCLRGLSQHAQRTGNVRIPWGGTKNKDWAASGKRVLVHFSKRDYREAFLSECRRLLPTDLWKLVSQSDQDPAVRQK